MNAIGTERRSVKRIMAGVIPVTLATQVLSFLSSLALANVLGATTATDAYFLALSVPLITFGILQAALRLGAIPALTERNTKEPSSFSKVSSELFTAVAIGATVASLVTTAIAAILLPAAVSGSPHNLGGMTRTMVLELAPLGLLGALVGVLGAVLAVRGSFLPAAAALGLEPIAKTILVLTLGHSSGATTLVVGNLVGSVLAVAFLWAYTARRDIRIRLVRSPHTQLVKDVLKLSGPLLISQSVLQVNPLIDRSMAAGINSGSVTELELGLRLFFVPAGLIGATLVAPLAATWAARVAEEGEQALSDSVSSAIRAVALIVPPLAVVGLILKTHLITLLYAGGAYTPSALHHTADVFGLLLIGLPANILVVVLATLFIVRRDAIFPMKIAIANVVLNVVLNFLLRPGLGVAGIALSTSLTFIILVCVYAVVAQRRWRTFDFAKLRGPFARAALSAAGIAAAGGAIMLAVPFGDDRAGAVAAIACVGTAALAVHAAVHFIGPGRDWIAFTTRFRATTPRPHG